MPNEENFLKEYDPIAYTRPNCTVDIIILTVKDEALHVLTIKRDAYPFKGCWSLVGGFIDVACDIDLESTARRKLFAKTGVSTPYLEQLCTVGNKTRDPRGWTVTTVYFALLPHGKADLAPGKNVTNVQWSKVSGTGIEVDLAFDHNKLLAICLDRLRSKVLYTSLPVHLMAETFTLGELQKTYEIILGTAIPHKSFRRRLLGANILEETGTMSYESKRPAMVYRLNQPLSTHYFMRNLEGAVLAV